MTDFNKKLRTVILENVEWYQDNGFMVSDAMYDALEKVFKATGWIHLPNAEGRNVTVFTHDSPEERFMTWDEWVEEAAKQGWSKK